MPAEEHTVRKEMGYTHDEFMRLLPKAVGGADMQIHGNEIYVHEGDRLLRIEVGPESERRIGFFRIPILPVGLHFSGYDAAALACALERFARAFQKGGG